MAGIIVNKPMKVIRGRDVVKRPSKPKELSNKHIEVK